MEIYIEHYGYVVGLKDVLEHHRDIMENCGDMRCGDC